MGTKEKVVLRSRSKGSGLGKRVTRQGKSIPAVLMQSSYPVLKVN